MGSCLQNENVPDIMLVVHVETFSPGSRNRVLLPPQAHNVHASINCILSLMPNTVEDARISLPFLCSWTLRMPFG